MHVKPIWPNCLATLFLGCALAACSVNDGSVPDADGGTPDRPSEVQLLEVLSVDSLNTSIDPNRPVVDVAFAVTEDSGVSWSALQTAVSEGRGIFASVGVQVRVVYAARYRVPESWQTLDAPLADTPRTPGYLTSDLYRHLEESRERLSGRSEQILLSLVNAQGLPNNHKVIQVVTLRNVPLGYWQHDGNAWQRGTVERTGALSLPPYYFEDRLPPALRGVITVSYDVEPKILYHEFGHKLINVSHEGASACPAFEVEGSALMQYGDGTIIGAGPANRYHQERLLRSPWLYTGTGTGTARRYNTAYQANGRYSDPVYGSLVMSPVCP